MVAAELRADPYADGTQLLVITNYGPSIARNVRVRFDPEIPDPPDPASSVTPFLKRRYAVPIDVLTPGMVLDNIYFSMHEPGEGNAEPTPEQVTVLIDYEGDDGYPYDDRFALDTNLLRNRTYVVSSTSPGQQRKEMVKALQAIAKALSGRPR